MSIAILRGDARSLPLPDGCADLVVTSPPYWSLRDYKDGGESLAGQIGTEPTWQEYIANLTECTAEWARVLKPGGSMFVVLGDAYANDAKWGGATSGKHVNGLHGKTGIGRARRHTELPPKSLIGLPWRYVFSVQDELGLTMRAEIIWEKLNGLPESVRDRVVRGHETIFELGFGTMLHLTRQARYFHATDEIREPHQPQSVARARRNRFAQDLSQPPWGSPNTIDPASACDPLGKMPRSVWTIPSAPLNVPDHIEHAACCAGRKRPGCEDGLDHHAAYPPELVKRIILGWCPSGICLECGEGRRPVIRKAANGRIEDPSNWSEATAYFPAEGRKPINKTTFRRGVTSTIIGYACACTPYTDHPERRKPTVTPSRELRTDNDVRAEAIGRRHHGDDWPERLPVRDYHFDRWEPPPTRPALVVDPFSGTGTTLLVAEALGRNAIGVDRSHDYCRLARWRTADPGERARARQVPKPPVIPPGQDALFSVEAS